MISTNRHRNLAKASVAALTLVCAFGSPQIAAADAVSTSATDGFGRILFTLEPMAHGDISVAAGVLTIHFDRKVAIDPNTISQALSAYVGSARADADGQTYRFALTQDIKPHTSISGNRLAVDLTPDSFNGAPPNLPLLPARDAPVDVSKLPVLAVNAGTYTSYSRVVFNWPHAVKYTVFPSGGHLTVRFAAAANPDFSALERIAPPWVKHGAWRVENGATSIEFETDPGSKHRVSTDGTKIVLDILSPRTDAAATPGNAGAASSMPAGVSAAQKAAVVSAANQLNDAGSSKTPEPAKTAALAGNVAAQPPPQAFGKDAPTNLALASGMPKLIVPPIAIPPQAPPQVAAARTADGATLTFPGAKTIAAFIRADTAWIVVQGGAPLNLATLQTQLGDFPSSVVSEKNGDTTVVRIGLKQAEQIGVQSGTKAIGVMLGPHVVSRAAALTPSRNDDDQKHSALVASVPGATQKIASADPIVGDTLIIVPSQPGHGVGAPRRYLEFTAIPTAAGFVIAPTGDDLDVTVAQSRVSITQPGGLALTPPSTPIPDSPAAFARAADSAFIDFQHWGKTSNGEFLRKQQALRQRAASASPADGFQGRLALARFYVANSFGAEALGLVRLMEANDPALETNPRIRILRAAANYMMGRYRDAHTDLADPMFDNSPHAAFWRGLTEAALENWSVARDALAQAEPSFRQYPIEWQAAARVASANALLATGRPEAARRTLRDIPVNLPPDLALNAQLVDAELLSRSGKHGDADAEFAIVEASHDGHAAAEAVYDQTTYGLAEGHVSTAAAIDALEGLRFRWRGDALELKTLRKLGALYFASQKWREGLQMLRIASQHFPDDEQGRVAQDDMRAAFDRLFLKGGADKLSPIQALAIFYDFIDLTPIGPNGDEMIRRMSDRLIAVDLLGPAAKLLKYQVENRLDGVARAQVATRLATLDLLDRRPQDALEALRTTRITGLPEDVNHTRMLLEARALSAMKGWDRALEVLAVDQAADTRNLRADIYWQSGNWEVAGEKSEELISGTPETPAALASSARELLMRAAIAYSLAGNQAALNRLRNRFASKVQGTPDASAFAVVSQKTDAQGAAFKDVAARVASVDTLQAFMDDFRKHSAASN
jgi:hypothetical protein